jgi:hypothetical protein
MNFSVDGAKFYPHPRLASSPTDVASSTLHNQAVEETTPRKRLQHHPSPLADSFMLQKHSPKAHIIATPSSMLVPEANHTVSQPHFTPALQEKQDKTTSRHTRKLFPFITTTGESTWALNGAVTGGTLGAVGTSIYLLIAIGIKRFLRYEGMHTTILIGAAGGGLAGFALASLLSRFTENVKKHLNHRKTT